MCVGVWNCVDFVFFECAIVVCFAVLLLCVWCWFVLCLGWFDACAMM